MPIEFNRIVPTLRIFDVEKAKEFYIAWLKRFGVLRRCRRNGRSGLDGHFVLRFARSN